MKNLFFVFVLCVSIFAFDSASEAGVYETSAQNAIQWIESQQKIDGSWGDDEKMKPTYTAEVVEALRSYYDHSPAYYRGMAWLENHDFANLDYTARKVLALLPHGDDVQALVDNLLASQRTSFSGTAGWGLTAFYDMAPLDTALELRTLSQTAWNDHGPVLSYLRTAQNGDGGWTIAEEGTSDILTAARVVQALCLYRSVDPSLYNDVIAPAETFLDNNVNTVSPALIKADTVLALWPNSRYPAKVVGLVDSLTTSQDPGGHWEGDVYTTALVVRAISTVLGKDPEAQGALSGIPDSNLRSAINLSFDKNEADALTAGEMETLTNLNGQGRGISDLTGISDAVNLEYADLKNNEITSLLSLMDLPDPESITVLLDGNPLSDTEDADGDGYSDLSELNAGTNPLDATSFPPAPYAVPALNVTSFPAVFLLLLILGATAALKGRKEMKILLTVLTLFAAFPDMGTAGQPRAESRGLEAGQTGVIQEIGSSVLSARISQPPDPEILRLKEELKGLRLELKGALEHLLTPQCKGTIHLQKGVDPVKAKNQKKHESPELQSAGRRVREALAKVKETSRMLSDRRPEDRHFVVITRMLTRVDALGLEVEDVLADNSPEQIGRLKALLERMEIKPQVTYGGTPREKPHLTTIVRHRR